MPPQLFHFLCLISSPPTSCPIPYSFLLNESFVSLAYSCQYLPWWHPYTWNKPANPPNVCFPITILKVILVSEDYLRLPIHPPVLFINQILQTLWCLNLKCYYFYFTTIWFTIFNNTKVNVTDKLYSLKPGFPVYPYLLTKGNA
jgi:hypothetical protein